MSRIYRALIAGFAVVFGLGLALVSAPAASASDDVKREDDVREVSTVDDLDDDPDDDTNTGNNTRFTGDRSGVSNDATNSRHTNLTNDADRSRGDLTRDFTRDGGDRTRDWTRNSTNDRSRNDTR